MQHDPATEDLFVLLLNDDGRSPEALGNGSSSPSEPRDGLHLHVRAALLRR